MTNGRLHANDLEKKQKEKHKENHKIYKQLLEDCEKKIEYQSSIGNTLFVYQVPYMKMGFPIYNITHAIMYIIRKLKENGFQVMNLIENKLFITIEKNKKQQPKSILKKK